MRMVSSMAGCIHYDLLLICLLCLIKLLQLPVGYAEVSEDEGQFWWHLAEVVFLPKL